MWLREALVGSLLVLLSAAVSAQSATFDATVTSDSASTTLVIKNNRAVEITACAYRRVIHHSRDGKSYEVIETGLRDPALNLGDKPILPGRTGSFRFEEPNSQVELKAILWVDGITYGDPVWIHKLTQRRVLALKHVSEVISVLQDGITFHHSRSMIASVIRERAAELRAEADDPDELPGADLYYRQVTKRMTEAYPHHRDAPDFTDAEIIKMTLDELRMYRDQMSLYFMK
jgi:hypothetical protein